MLNFQHIRRVVLWAVMLPVAAAGQAFEVASVKPSNPGSQSDSNFPLGPGDVYVPNGGYFSATGFPLVTYIFFAYKVAGNQAQSLLPQLPNWATTERFDIQARAEGNPGKDQMRLMMRALLAERFKLATHNETREAPVFAFVLAKKGTTGPQLQPHSDDGGCPINASAGAQPQTPPRTRAGELPALCNGIFPMPASEPGRLRFDGRNVTIGFIADTFSAGTNLGHPMVDQTGLTGKFDFILEWMPERRSPAPPGAETPADPTGPSFEQALRDQLGIKLQAQKSPMAILVVDHVERPSAN
jgi:uncharacterized protein (TIGR03435 family)